MYSPNDPGDVRTHPCRNCGRSLTGNRPLCGACRNEMARKHRAAWEGDDE